jgi:Glutaredoxin and related proteins
MEIKSLTIYSTVECPYCHLLKDWLGKKGIAYKNIFVDKDEKAADRMIQISGQMGVPVTEIFFTNGKNEIVVGFDKPKIAKLLNIKE